MTNKERYVEWAATQEFLPISMQPWWLDAVCAGKEWNVLLAEDENKNILGMMPYLLRKRLWYKYIVMPVAVIGLKASSVVIVMAIVQPTRTHQIHHVTDDAIVCAVL